MTTNISPIIRKDVLCQDWQTFMPALAKSSVDLILTDPPYTISRETGFSKVKTGVARFAVSMDFGKWDHQKIDLDSFALACYRALRTSGTAIIWYDVWKISDVEIAMRKAGFKMLRLIIWQKTNPVPLNQSATYLSNSREIAVVGVKGGSPTFHGKYDNGIYNYPIPRHGGKKIHPTQKPIDLFAELVLKHSNAGDLVIDPFVGSGTTGVAAIENNRRFKGCDIDKTYAMGATARLMAIKIMDKKNNEQSNKNKDRAFLGVSQT
ncbi:MAG: site-specific DNA-methyltransferase [Proteobacteria bacterium]|nr:site-specific DNA-methyltransferase [Pseudomonadota bacterium]